MTTPPAVSRLLDSARTKPTGLVLALMCVAQFMVVLDISIVNVALPNMQHDLHMSASGLAWVLNAYTLTFAGFLLLGGRAADLYGRKRLFLLGITLFTSTSLLGGLAQNGGELIAARALQGIGGALLSPATLTILTTTFTEPRARSRALGMWSAVAGAGGATGVLLGGVLTDLLSWRWILFINVPIGIAVLVVARFALTESKGARTTMDWAGAFTITGALVALTYGVVSTDEHPWGSSLVIGFLIAGVVLLLAFLTIESRHPHPLMPLRLFRYRALTGANLIMIVVGATMFAVFFFMSQFLQDVQGYSPLRTGFAFLPMPIALIIATQIASRLVSRIGPRPLLVVGPLVSALGLVLLSGASVDSGYFPRMGLFGSIITFGMGLSLVPVTLAANTGVDRKDAGLASGLINTTRQIGGSLGLAVLLTIATSRSHEVADRGAKVAQTLGYDRAYLVTAAFLGVAALISLFMLGSRTRRSASTEAVVEAEREVEAHSPVVEVG